MSADPEIRFLGDVQRLHLADDDIVVIKVPDRLSAEIAARMMERVRSVLGRDRTVLVLDGGIDIGVVAPAADVVE